MYYNWAIILCMVYNQSELHIKIFIPDHYILPNKKIHTFCCVWKYNHHRSLISQTCLCKRITETGVHLHKCAVNDVKKLWNWVWLFPTTCTAMQSWARDQMYSATVRRCVRLIRLRGSAWSRRAKSWSDCKIFATELLITNLVKFRTLLVQPGFWYIA